MLPAIAIVKVAASLAASAGVNRIVSEVIKNNTTIVTVADKVLIGVGSLAVTSMVVETTTGHVDRMFQTVRNSRKKTTDEDDDTTEEA